MKPQSKVLLFVFALLLVPVNNSIAQQKKPRQVIDLQQVHRLMHGQVDIDDAEDLFVLLRALNSGLMFSDEEDPGEDGYEKYLEEELDKRGLAFGESVGLGAMSNELLVYLLFFFDLVEVQGDQTIFLHPSDQYDPFTMVTRQDGQDGIHLYFNRDAGKSAFITQALASYRDETSGLNRRFQPIESLDNPPPPIGLVDREEVESPFAVKNPEKFTRLIVDYDNTLFDQLLTVLLEPEELIAYIETIYDIKLGPTPGSEHAKFTQPFKNRKGELVALLKILTDLSKPVVKAMHLTHIARLQNGVFIESDDKVVEGNEKDRDAATYISDQNFQGIYLSDGAFKSFRVFGEGTIAHEFGHALWPALPLEVRRAFILISWRWAGSTPPTALDFLQPKSGDEAWQIRGGAERTEFITILPDRLETDRPYAMTSPEEDFCESMAAFITLSNRLREQAPSKHAFFNKIIFPHREFGFTGNAEFSLYLEAAGEQDSEPPFLTVDSNIEEVIKIDVVDDADNPEYFRLVCTVTGVFDVGTGIKEICVSVKAPHDTGSWRQIKMKLSGKDAPAGHCIDRALGKYSITSQPLSKRSQFDCVYGLYEFNALDNNGRRARFSTTGHPGVDIPGEAPVEGRKRRKIGEEQLEARPETHPLQERGQQQRIVVNALPGEVHPKLGQAFGVELPIDTEDLAEVEIVVKDSKDQTINYGASYNQLADFIEISSPDSLTMQLILPRQVEAGPASLTFISLKYRATDKLASERYSIPIENDLDNVIMNVTLSEPDTTPPSLVSDLYRRDLVQLEEGERNQLDGTQNVKIRMPIQGIDNGHQARVRAEAVYPKPAGSVGDASTDKPTETRTDFASEGGRRRGVTFYYLEFPIRRLPNTGQFRLIEVEVTEYVPPPRSIPKGFIGWRHDFQLHRLQIPTANRAMRQDVFIDEKEKH